MKKISNELKTLIITNMDIKKDIIYQVKFLDIGFLSISNEFIEDTKDYKLSIDIKPTNLHYWELLYILYIIKEYNDSDNIFNLIEIWSN